MSGAPAVPEMGTWWTDDVRVWVMRELSELQRDALETKYLIRLLTDRRMEAVAALLTEKSKTPEGPNDKKKLLDQMYPPESVHKQFVGRFLDLDGPLPDERESRIVRFLTSASNAALQWQYLRDKPVDFFVQEQHALAEECSRFIRSLSRHHHTVRAALSRPGSHERFLVGEQRRQVLLDMIQRVALEAKAAKYVIQPEDFPALPRKRKAGSAEEVFLMQTISREILQLFGEPLHQVVATTTIVLLQSSDEISKERVRDLHPLRNKKGGGTQAKNRLRPSAPKQMGIRRKKLS